MWCICIPSHTHARTHTHTHTHTTLNHPCGSPPPKKKKKKRKKRNTQQIIIIIKKIKETKSTITTKTRIFKQTTPRPHTPPNPSDEIATGRKKMFDLTTHSTHFIYGYMAPGIW